VNINVASAHCLYRCTTHFWTTFHGALGAKGRAREKSLQVCNS